MGTTGHDMKNHRAFSMCFPLAPAAACIALAWPAAARAADWTITPGVELRETWTDNVNLAADGSKREDFVTEFTPHVGIKATGARLKLGAEYAMRNYFYSRSSGASSTNHQLQATANAELVENLFYLDGRATAGQQAISPFGAHVVDDGHVTNNKADVRTYGISPYLRHHFGSAAVAELRYSRDSVSSDNGGLSDSESNRYRIGLNSGTGFRTLHWGVQYDDQRIDYERTDDVRIRQITGSLRYAITPRVTLLANAGYEDNNYVNIGEKPEGEFWSLGATWAPSERTNVSVTAGHRFFGNTLSVSAYHRTRMTVWSLGYQEEITTARSQFLVPSTQDTAAFLNGMWASSIPDAAARQDLVQNFIREANLPSSLVVPINSFTNRVFLQKNAYASLAIKGVRNTLLTSVYRVEREPQSGAAADLSLSSSAVFAGEASRQDGISTAWNLSLSPRTSVTASAGLSKIHSDPTGRRDDNLSFRLGVSRQFRHKLRGGVELRRLEKRSTEASAEYRENAVAAFLQISF